MGAALVVVVGLLVAVVVGLTVVATVVGLTVVVTGGKVTGEG